LILSTPKGALQFSVEQIVAVLKQAELVCRSLT